MLMKITVSGIVQGVGFRPFIYRIAVKNGLSGYVRNRGDSCVEIVLEGEESDIKSFLKDLVEKRPPLAKIYEIITTPIEGRGGYSGFKICESTDEAEMIGSIIPPDIAICNECLSELRDPSNPRHDYFFITCVNCGPRYTIIEDIPYDRDNTTMRDFQMCDYCRSEYIDPANRRFHAQTIACPRCGPKAYLTTGDGWIVECGDPIREAGKLISEGSIVAIKGYGGFHIAASTLIDKPIEKLRRAKHRRQKPFAIMARSLEAAKTFAEISPWEAETLTSYARPIVLLNKSENYYLSDLISPGLHNIGVMLPYTGLHYMLFDSVRDPAFVMTSANPPNQPIIKDDNEAFEKMRGLADYFLLHNRRISQRCDDSVIRLHGNRRVFIRRSRGYVPDPIRLKEFNAKECALGLGGEKNNTSCLVIGDKAFLSQHIGDVENIETLEFLKSASMRLMHLTNSRVNVVACDLHPKFATTLLAKRLSEENSWRIVQVQHHYAHTAALMAEHGLSEVIAICCDGYGYGDDGGAWGGEIILGSLSPLEFKRLGHLEEQPLIGGDMATRYPLRMATGILYKRVNIEDWLMENSAYLPYGIKEMQVILAELKRGEVRIKTTSCGRILDAASAILGVCYERTYEGEPAMKLESVAIHGVDILKIEPQIKGNTLNTTDAIVTLFEMRDKLPRRDLAYSIHAYLARGLAQLAIELAIENNVKNVGFTGGVACNQIIAEEMRKIVEHHGLNFFTHETVPPGDGGLSLGQAIVASIY